MRGLLPILFVAALGGCTQVQTAVHVTDTAFAAAIDGYCHLPKEVREINRQRVNMKIHPHRIQIFCADTP